MSKYELVKQKFTDRTNKSWAAEYADTIEEAVLGIFDTLGIALRFRKFIVDEKRYSDSPTGVSASEAYYVREKAEGMPTPDPAKKPRHSAVLQFQGHEFEMSVVKAMELKALMENFIPGAVVLVSPNEAGTEVVGEEAAQMNVQFIPNNPETRKTLVEGTLYLTIYQGATTICRSIYAGNDCWKNPGTQELTKNSVAFFALASVFDIPGFKGWNEEAQ